MVLNNNGIVARKRNCSYGKVMGLIERPIMEEKLPLMEKIVQMEME